MNTLEITLQLIHTLENNPASLSQIPWQDLKICLTTELEYRKELYPIEQFLSINQLFQTKFQELDINISISNIFTVIQLLKEFVFFLQTLPNIEYTDSLLQQMHYNEARLHHYVNNTFIVMGDSHVNFFSGNEQLTYIPIGNNINLCPNITDNPFTVLHLGPCLAYNCNKPNSSTFFHEKVEYLCNNFIKPNAHIIFCLGEIDIRVHVFNQTKLQNKTYMEIIDQILEKYISFLLSIQEKGFQISCWGPIATQREICPVDPTFPRNGSETARNMATAYFNERLSMLCMQHNIQFISIFNKLITDNFHTKEKYLSSDHCHLSQHAQVLAQPIWEKLLFS